MPRTLQDILIDINSYLDLEAALPTGDELTLRQNFANQAIWDAAATGQLSEFDKNFETPVTTLASISLPSDFREFKRAPQVLDSSGAWNEYDVIKPEERFDKSIGDRYSYILGNPRDGYTVIFNQLITNATISILYQRFPSGLLTLADVSEIPDPTFVSTQVESYVLQSRGDERFPFVNSVAQQKLQNMIGREGKPPGGQSRDLPGTPVPSNPLG